VKDIDLVLRQLFGSDVQRVLSGLHKATLFTVFNIRELDSAISNHAAAEFMQFTRFLHDVLGEGDALAEQEALVTIEVTYEFGIWANLSILLDQGSDRRRETGR
jgi:hypothetical protein